MDMLEFIIRRCFAFVWAFLGFTVLLYYVEKLPLKESVGLGLYVGILLAAMPMPTQYVADYIIITLGIMAFLLTIVLGYYMYKQPLKNSIKMGLIVGIGYVTWIILIRPTIEFLFDLIV